MRDCQDAFRLVNGLAANGVDGSTNIVRDYRHIVLALSFAGTAGYTVKVLGSIQRDKPDFEAARTQSNHWEYIQCKDLEDQASIPGDTGFVVASDDVRLVEVNTNGLNWIAIEISGYSSGQLYVDCMPFND